MSIYYKFTYFLLSILIFSSSVLASVPATSSSSSSTISSSKPHDFRLLTTEYEPNLQQIILNFSDSTSIAVSYIFDIEFYNDNHWISTNEYTPVSSPDNATYELPQRAVIVLDTFPFNTESPGMYRVKLFIKSNGKNETVYLPFEVIDPNTREAAYFKNLTYESEYFPSTSTPSSFTKYSDSFYSALPDWVINQLKRGYELGPILIKPNDCFTIYFKDSSHIDYNHLSLSVKGQNTTIDSLNYSFSLPNLPKYTEASSTLTPEFTQSTLSLLTYTENYISDFLEIPFSLTTEEKHKLIQAIVKEQPLILQKNDFTVTLESIDNWLMESIPSISVSLHKTQQIELHKELSSFIDEQKSLMLFNEAGFNNSEAYFSIIPDFGNYHHIVWVTGNINQPSADDCYWITFQQASLVSQKDDSKFSTETFYTVGFDISQDDFIKHSDTLLANMKNKVLALQSITKTTSNEKTLDQILNGLSKWKSESEMHEYNYWSPGVFPDSLYQSGTAPLIITETFVPNELSKKDAPHYIATSNAYADHVYICLGWYGN